MNIQDRRKDTISEKIREYIIIPRILINDKNINKTDCIVFGNIYSLSKKFGFCFATNGKLAELSNIGTRTIGYSLCKLKRGDYIAIKYEKNNNNDISRKIYITNKVMQELASHDMQ